MAQRYNPPPNWPTPPEGWEPPEGWQPDPSWGPPPPGWSVFVDEPEVKKGFRERMLEKNEASKAKLAASKEARKADAVERDAAKAEKAEAKQADAAASVAELRAQGILFKGKSHDEGRNADVTLYRDRIERVKAKKFGSMSGAAQDVEMTPMRSVSSVQAKKDGLAYTKVTVFASGNNIEFRLFHNEAAQFRDALQQLLLEPAPPASAPVAAAPAAPDLADQLRKLAELRDAGILTDDEFATKKADLLSRM